MTDHLTYGQLVEFANEMRTKPRAPKPDCWVMNQYWCGLLAAENPEWSVSIRGVPYITTDWLGMPIYIDETYPEPIMRNAAEYLAERNAHDGE